jgi:hypothetical protein
MFLDRTDKPWDKEYDERFLKTIMGLKSLFIDDMVVTPEVNDYAVMDCESIWPQ